MNFDAYCRKKFLDKQKNFGIEKLLRVSECINEILKKFRNN